VIQGSNEWLAERAGCVTASCFKNVLAKIKSGEASTRRNYRLVLVTERLTGQPLETYENEAMRWGKAQEPFARMAYEESTGYIVEEVGFLKHPSIEWCGGSPDGCIDDDGLIEIKCPYVSTVHVETLQSGMPSEHMAQCQGNLWISGRHWIDFVSFDPRMPPHLQLYTERVRRDDRYIAILETEVHAFLKEVNALHMKLMDRRTLTEMLIQSVDPNALCTQA
jgi:putative phage-type endonuclease